MTFFTDKVLNLRLVLKLILHLIILLLFGWTARVMNIFIIWFQICFFHLLTNHIFKKVKIYLLETVETSTKKISYRAAHTKKDVPRLNKTVSA